MSESLRDYIAERADIIDVFEVRNQDGGIDFMLKIDGTYSDDGAEGMLEYHRQYFRDVLKFEDIEIGKRS